MTNEPKVTRLPKRRAKSWPLLLECIAGTYEGTVQLPSWKVLGCTASKDGTYLLRVSPAGKTAVRPFIPRKKIASMQEIHTAAQRSFSPLVP